MLRLMLLTVILGGTTGRYTVDLTHTFDEEAPKYPLTAYGFPLNVTYFKTTTWIEQFYPDGMWLSLRYIEFYEHMGTHMDAPLHFGAGRWSMEEIPVDRLIGPGVNIDVRDKVKKDPNYALTVNDIKDYEKKYGRIPRNAIVMMNSGWGEFYPNPKKIFGSDDVTNSSTFNFPGYSLEACKFLLAERQVSVVGIDTPSTDPAGFADCHRYLQPNNVPLLDYVANLDAMPAKGCTIFLGAMKHRQGTGGQTRIICIVEDDDEASRGGSSHAGWLVPVALVLMAWWISWAAK